MNARSGANHRSSEVPPESAADFEVVFRAREDSGNTIGKQTEDTAVTGVVSNEEEDDTPRGYSDRKTAVLKAPEPIELKKILGDRVELWTPSKVQEGFIVAAQTDVLYFIFYDQDTCEIFPAFRRLDLYESIDEQFKMFGLSLNSSFPLFKNVELKKLDGSHLNWLFFEVPNSEGILRKMGVAIDPEMLEIYEFNFDDNSSPSKRKLTKDTKK